MIAKWLARKRNVQSEIPNEDEMPKQLNDKFGRDKIMQIVKIKHQWDDDTSPLIDGTLPAPGPFDRDSDTVASASKSSEGWREQAFIHSCVLMASPKTVLEIGTNVGVSSAYIASALKARGSGRVHTIDASPYRVRMAKRLHKELDLDNVDYTIGLFYEVLPKVLESLPPIDMAFVDGQHEYQATVDFYDMIARRSAPGAVLLFDDIFYSDGMKRAWSEIQANPRCFAVSELGNIGIMMLKGEATP